MDTQAQTQAIVDKLSGAGKEPLPLAAFDHPWRKIYFRVARDIEDSRPNPSRYQARSSPLRRSQPPLLNLLQPPQQSRNVPILQHLTQMTLGEPVGPYMGRQQLP